MNKKLIFLDIDGTLTSPGRQAPPESSLRAIREARARGHRVFLCTGRDYAMLEPLLQYGFDGAVGSAGGYVLCGGKVLYDMPMANEVRDRACRVLEEAGFAWAIECLNGVYGTEENFVLMAESRDGGSEAQRWREAAKSDLKFCSIDEYDGAPVYKIMFIGRSDADLDRVERELGGEFFVCLQNVFAKESHIHGELINRAFDKGTGVRRICEYLGVPIEDTVGFGDSMNDLAMLETVGIGVCMANGEEKLKEISHMVCPSVEEDGIWKAFVQLGLIEG